MTKTKKTFLIALCSTAVGVTSLAVTNVMKSKNAFADEAVLHNITVEKSYGFGESLVFAKDGELEYKGKNYPVQKAYLVYPDGKTHLESEYLLNTYGEYTAIFETLVEDKIVSKTENFTVKKGYYKLGNPDSSIGFGELNRSFVNMGYTKGLQLGLTEGDTFYYNKVINIYEQNFVDLISFNCLQYDTVCKNINVRLTDVYDSSKYMEIHYSRGSYEYQTYINVSAYGDRKFGLTPNANGNIVIDGANYSTTNDLNENNGTVITGNLTLNMSYYNFGYELDTTDHKNIKVYVRYGNGSNLTLVSELNNPSIYEYAFDGFTDGNVYLTMTASGLSGVSQAPIEIAKIDGKSGTELAYTDFCEDTTAPVFFNESGVTDGKIVVGDVAIKVPTVYAYDDTGVKGSNLADYVVWYNKGQNSESMVAVQNGVFYPEKLGVYTIEYSATDYFGNRGVYDITLNGTLTGDNGIEFNVTPFGETEAGRKVKFNNYTLKGINGEVSVEIDVVDPFGKKQTVSPSEEYLLSAVGKYQLIYRYSDALYLCEKPVEIDVKSSSAPVFEDTSMNFNEYYIKGFNYSVEKKKAFNYTENGKVEVEVETYAKFDGGEFTVIDPDAVYISGNETVQFKYVCKDTSVELTSEIIKIVNAKKSNGNLDITKYFQGNFTNISVGGTGTTITSTEQTTKVDFINPLSLYAKFGVRFFISEANAPKKMTMTVTDYYDRTNRIKIELTNKNSYSINGKPSRTLMEPWVSYTTTVAYENGSLQIGNTKTDYVSNFVSGLCFISFEFEKAENPVTVKFESVSEQTMTDVNYDINEPIISYKAIDKVANLGDVVAIPRPYACDVLSPNSMANLKMSVYKNKKIYTSTEGVSLKEITDFTKEYKILLDEYGTYLIRYTYEDQAGNELTSSFTVSVIDAIAPEITLTNPVSVQKAKVGESIRVLDYVITDNESTQNDITVWVLVMDKYGNPVFGKRDSEKEKATMSFSNAGKYTVYLYAKDGIGNATYVSYVIDVK